MENDMETRRALATVGFSACRARDLTFRVGV